MNLKPMISFPRLPARKFLQLTVAVLTTMIFVLGCYHFVATDMFVVVIRDQHDQVSFIFISIRIFIMFITHSK